MYIFSFPHFYSLLTFLQRSVQCGYAQVNHRFALSGFVSFLLDLSVL